MSAMCRPDHDGERAAQPAAHILEQRDRARRHDDRLGRRSEIDERAVEIEEEGVAAGSSGGGGESDSLSITLRSPPS